MKFLWILIFPLFLGCDGQGENEQPGPTVPMEREEEFLKERYYDKDFIDGDDLPAGHEELEEDRTVREKEISPEMPL